MCDALRYHEAKIDPYLDERLSEMERAAVEDHLRECAGCAEQLRLLRRAGQVLAASGPADVPEGLAARLAEGALTARPTPASSTGLAGLLDGLRWPAVATAAAAVVVAIGLTVATPRPEVSLPDRQDAVAALMGEDDAEVDVDGVAVVADVLAVEEE